MEFLFELPFAKIATFVELAEHYMKSAPVQVSHDLSQEHLSMREHWNLVVPAGRVSFVVHGSQGIQGRI